MPNNKLLIALVLTLFFSFGTYSQNKKDDTKTQDPITVVDTISVKKKPIDPLTPSKAAFYSAILPGLGQAYNKKYWKIPIVVGGLTTGILIYTHNDKQYNRYRDAYKQRLAGYEDEFFGQISTDGLREAQKQFRRNKEISLLVTIGIYALNIIDANVDAHLLQYNVDKDLTLQPHFNRNELDGKNSLGLSLNFKF